jgi:hypothetical protein
VSGVNHLTRRSGSAGVGADRLLTADEDELTADAPRTDRKLVGHIALEEALFPDSGN